MYDYLKGLPTDKRKTDRGTFVTIEVAGIGYLLEVSERDYSNISIFHNVYFEKLYQNRKGT